MCGIVGGISPRLSSPDLRHELVRCLAHRGPDDEGEYFDEQNNIFLGQTRLAIIDLNPSGHQPMQYTHAGRTFWITFNGEIYNYKELKQELEKLGHKFATHSDTEVILAGYAQWGMPVVERLRGMFAFALWDEQKQELTLGRDRFGVKPLFYYKHNNELVFCSEISVLKKWPGFSKTINHNALSLFLQLGFISGSETIFEHVTRVTPGSYATLNKHGEIIKEEKYWQPEDYIGVPVHQHSAGEALDAVEKVLAESFKYRLVADVPVGVFLSGGVDSALVTALLQKDSAKQLKTFTIGFAEKGYDEAPAAKKIAEHLHTDHTELYISEKDILNEVAKYGELFDEPFGDASGLPTLLLARLARKQVKVALSGDGGDELFGGYTKYRTLQKLQKYPRVMRGILGSAAAMLHPTVASALFKTTNTREKLSKLKIASWANNFAEMYLRASSYWSPKEVAHLLLNAGTVGTPHLVESTRGVERQMQLWDLEHYLPNDILVKSDRTTMRAGLEAREPFLDQEVWRTLNELPDSIVFKDFGNKKILKDILARHLPQNLFDRPKSGFRPPMHEWLAGPLRTMVYELLSPELIKKQGVFNPAVIAQLLAAHRSGAYVNPDKLWLLLAFSLWYNEWFL